MSEEFNGNKNNISSHFSMQATVKKSISSFYFSR